jgi:uncharacterized protein (TIGR03437 family)
MGPCFKRTLLCVPLLGFSLPALVAQTSFNGRCQVSSTPLQVRAEGLAERVGDIGIQCSGGTPGSTLSGNLTLYLPVSVSNRVDADNFTTDAVVSIDSGTGFAPSAVRGKVSGNSIAFNGLSFSTPTGSLNLRVSGVRAAISQFGSGAQQPVLASISSTLPVDQAQVVVAYPRTGLTATLYSTGITCVGSPAPATFTLANLFAAGTFFASTRLTEGFSSAFEPKQLGATNGVRFLVKYSGLPAGARLYVPDAVAGSDALSPTSGGDLGIPQSVGQYVPGSNTLVLVRVNGADATGSGGFAVAAPQGSGPQVLNSVSEVPLTGGSGFVVYEVADANPAIQESAQFPTFITLTSVTAPATVMEVVSLAPVSQVATASATAPIPRFVAATAPSDCSALGDCSASYFPKLMADATPIKISAVANGGPMTSPNGYITVRNAGGGLLAWSVAFNYQSGSGWLFADYPSGIGNASVRVWSDTKTLSVGTYQATITINAGSAGSQTIPVTLTVTPAPPTPPPPPTTSQPVVSQVVNAASFEVTPLVAGSLGTVMGSHLSGKSVSAAFDGVAATILYASDSQLNLQVPAALAAKTSANLVMTVDGVASAPKMVTLAPAWPAIFAHGVLNQDSSLNGESAAAVAGDILQVFLTGIPKNAVVSGQIGDQKNLAPLYSGDAPTVPGVQQVNLAVPPGAGAGSTLVLCATPPGGQAICSTPYALAVK